MEAPLTYLIIAVTVGVSLLAFGNTRLKGSLLFYPVIMRGPEQYYRFFSHGLIHADYIHLGFNMLTLFFFGRVLESMVFTPLQFILLYVSALVASSLSDFFRYRNNRNYAALGASGAVSALVFATITLDPWARGICLYGALCLPNILFGVLYVVYCIYMDKRAGDNIAHSAHLWGSIYGLVFTFIVRPDLMINFFNRLMHPRF
jgi:membrane associated rhomboid family serine protease